MAEKSERAQREEKILQFWKENKIFEKTLEKKAPKGEFVFYDGPPFATGLPHYGSLLSSIVKDVFPRYKTMRGFHVRRRWGWDCHGLPIENMVEKELGLKSKKEIEEMGVAKFNRFCRESVLKFADEWKVFVERIGRFVDYDHSYKTMDNSYIESVWWGLKEIYNKGLLYEGRKVLLYCPHCETPLAKAEIAMDQSYKDITEESVYVKFKIVGEQDTYLLAWTTTPWTLPGNVALAVGNGIDYVKVDMGEESLILAESRLSLLNEKYKIIKKLKGVELVGLNYEPLYEIPAVKESRKKVWYVTSGDFVNTEEGTGVVHTAVLYGEDDYNLGLRLDLPMVPLLDSAGHFNNQSPELIRGQYFKKAEKAIKEDLGKRGLLFRREMHTHSYPHCHRCGTALLYNAISSWFINIQKKKNRMIELNEDINWIPQHLKHGRFLNNLENAPDWTISRNRYWASPLPIWKDSEGKVCVIGSLDELKEKTKKSGNRYFVMRHGEAENNVKKILDLTGDPNNHLTQKGKDNALRAGSDLRREQIDLIITSPFLRAHGTAIIVQKELGLPDDAVIVDERLREIEPQENGKKVRRRMGEFIFDIEKRYVNKNILVISHGFPLWILLRVVKHAPINLDEKVIPLGTAEVTEISFVSYPHNEDYELDLHRPYIDEIKLVSEEGKSLKRIPEVMDGWVESSSMPFAEYHYPFENNGEFKKHFPADFIAEYIAQTRTWFYYMHAVATLLFNNISFRNVVTTGTILAADGSKMSKSKGNYTDPMANLNLFGADALRFYLMSSVIMQAEDIRFVDDEVRQIHNQVLNILWNSFKFYEIYADNEYIGDPCASTHILDKWILARLSGLTKIVTEGMNAFDTVQVTRPVRDFISDFSTWYIRRSRDRFRSSHKDDKTSAIVTTRYVLLELSKLIAPITPFIAEDIYRQVRKPNDPESVHLASWPTMKSSFSFLPFFTPKSSDKNLTKNMAEVRRIVSLALEARSKADIRVRQPLQKLFARVGNLEDDYIELIRDEINVKEVINKDIDGVELDTNLTPELIEEGRVREAIRTIQDLRKEKGLKPRERMAYQVPEELRDLFAKYGEEIKKVTNID